MEPMGGLEFLRDYGARRAGGYGDAPDFLTSSSGVGIVDGDETDGEEQRAVRDWDYEVPRDHWAPICVRNTRSFPHPELRPERFVDGKDVGRTVAYVLAPQGFPVPIRVSQIGAVAVRAVSSPVGPPTIRCESRRVEKVVSFMADLFPWDEVERFAAALYVNGYRLLITRKIGPQDDPRNFGWLNENARYRSREEMFRLERQAIALSNASNSGVQTPLATLADGRLDDKSEAIQPREAPVYGLIKSHANTSYLHSHGWDTVYTLQPGERTPLLAFRTDVLPLVTWYLRLCAPLGGGPLDGVVRVEVTRPFFEQTAQRDFAFIDALSHQLCESRTRDGGYSRAAVTLYPIQRAEDALRAQFEASDTLLSRFYRMTGL